MERPLVFGGGRLGVQSAQNYSVELAHRQQENGRMGITYAISAQWEEGVYQTLGKVKHLGMAWLHAHTVIPE